MTEVVNCGGGHRTWLRQLILCVLGCPLPPYIKEGRGGRPAPVGCTKERSPTRAPRPSRIPFGGRGKEEGRGRREGKGGGCRPLPLVQFGPKGGGGATSPLWPFSLP